MSTIRVNNLQNTSTTDGGISIDTSGHVTVDGVAMPSSGPLSNRNLVINGAMQVAQRGTSLSLAHDGTTNGYLTDRFRVEFSGTDQYDCTVTQSTDAPEGFASSTLITTGTAETTVDAAEYGLIQQKIEAQNLQLLSSGTSNAKTTTLSFWVKSSQTGTYVVSIYKHDSTARNITATYAISTADTWEHKTLTFAGDTDSSAGINDDNGIGWIVSWVLGAGSNYTSTDSTSWIDYVDAGFAYGQSTNGVLTTASATFAITGIQLEVGSVATPFEHRSYGDELARCQRYYYRETGNDNTLPGFSFTTYTSTAGVVNVRFPTTMRQAPSFNWSGTARIQASTDSASFTSGLTIGVASLNGAGLNLSGTSNMVTNASGHFQMKAANTYLEFISEL